MEDEELVLLDLLLDFPEDIFHSNVFVYLNIQDLCNCAETCKLFHKIVKDYFMKRRNVDIGSYGKSLSKRQLSLVLSQKTNIKHLVLKDCSSNLEDSILCPALKVNLSITHINLMNCLSLTNKTLLALKSSCSKLQSLVLKDCVWVTAEALVNLTINCSNLVELNLSGCWHVTDHCISTIAHHCKKLQRLNLSRIYGITDNALVDISKNLTDLRELNIKDCWRVTDDGLWFLKEFLKSLKLLFIAGCRSVTPVTMNGLVNRGIILDTTPKRYSARSAPLLQI